jgi:hypothetical protein
MNMSKATLLLALLLFAFTPCQGDAPGQAPADPAAAAAAGLWLKAVNIHRRNRNWYPERITILSEVLNRRGQPTSVTQFFFFLRLGADGRLDTKLARSLKNGEDTTLKMRGKVRIRDPRQGEGPDNEDTYSVSISDSPFVPERQHAVAFRAGSEKRLLYGHSCQHFDFSYRTTIIRKGQTEELIWNGMAWLQEGSGLPVKLEFTLTPLPSRIRSLWAIYLYDTAQPDRWVLRKVTISGQGGFLFIKKQFRTTTTFSDYRRPPANAGGR